MKKLTELLLEYKEGRVSFTHLLNIAAQYDHLYSTSMVVGSLGESIKPSRDFQRASRKVLQSLYTCLLSIQYTTETGEPGPVINISEKDKEIINKAALEFGIRPSWMEVK